MNLGQTVFSQLIEHLPHNEFKKCVARYSGDSYLKSFSCWNPFLAMAAAYRGQHVAGVVSVVIIPSTPTTKTVHANA
jgi:hypothetical protein